LGAQGANGTASAQDRIVIAGEIGAILQRLVGVADTSVEGRYVFSGDADQQSPYAIDLTQTNPVSAYQGSAATRQVQNWDGARITIGKTAQEIFDTPNQQQNVFVVVASLRTALLNNDQAGITSAATIFKPREPTLTSRWHSMETFKIKWMLVWRQANPGDSIASGAKRYRGRRPDQVHHELIRRICSSRRRCNPEPNPETTRSITWREMVVLLPLRPRRRSIVIAA